jgi:hypothetical protein
LVALLIQLALFILLTTVDAEAILCAGGGAPV